MTQMLEETMNLEEDSQKGKYLTFLLGNEEYGIEIKYVTEIIGLQVITEVPELPVYVKGIINLRGNIIPVIDVRARFNKEHREYNDKTCTIVIDVGNVSIGLIVDTVSEVLSIGEENIVPPPQWGSACQNRYIKSIGKVGNNVKLLLDCSKLMKDDELEILNNI